MAERRDRDRETDETSNGQLGEGAEKAPPAPPTRRFPSSNLGRPRIEGVEAGVAAGLVPSTGMHGDPREVPRTTPRHLAPGESLYEPQVPDEIAEGVELPDWTDPPTREVPRVLLRPGTSSEPVIPGPVWRESEKDFAQDQDAFAEMVSGTVPVIAHDEAGDVDDDFGFENHDRFEGIGPDRPSNEIEQISAQGPDGTDILPVGEANRGPSMIAEREEPAADAGGRVSFAGRVVKVGSRPEQPAGAGEPPSGQAPSAGTPNGRNPVVATVTGLAIGGVALICFAIGPAASLAIACLVLLLAAAECFQALRRARFEPAALIGLVAAPGFAIAGYLKGTEAIPFVAAVAIVATIGWYLVGVTRRHVVANISVSLLGIAWIGLLGSFAGLLLDPTAFPHSHGVAYLLGAAEVTVAYDVGGYAFGSVLGKHKLAPALSPNKTWEGLVGGSLSALVVALAVTSFMAPWTLERALWLGIVAAIVAPLGDLAESMIKRDLRVKDMGRLLPAHGGVLDRVDALLFVLPATYFLVRLFHG